MFGNKIFTYFILIILIILCLFITITSFMNVYDKIPFMDSVKSDDHMKYVMGSHHAIAGLIAVILVIFTTINTYKIINHEERDQMNFEAQ